MFLNQTLAQSNFFHLFKLLFGARSWTFLSHESNKRWIDFILAVLNTFQRLKILELNGHFWSKKASTTTETSDLLFFISIQSLSPLSFVSIQGFAFWDQAWKWRYSLNLFFRNLYWSYWYNQEFSHLTLRHRHRLSSI